jgi:hypothetical protein
MIGFLVLLFPVLLMAFMLIMERIEVPLTRVADERDVQQLLDQGSQAEIDTLVREGTDSALRRFRSRLRLRPRARRRG